MSGTSYEASLMEPAGSVHSEQTGTMASYVPVAFWALLALAHLPLLVVHFTWMWRQEAYHYLPALGLALGLLFASRWDRVLRLPSSYTAWAVLVFSCCLLLPAAVWRYSPWLGALAFVLSMGAFLLSQNGAEAQRHGGLLRLWPLAWLLLPLPMNLDQSLTASLQLRSSLLSSYLLDLSNVPHMLLGNVIELPSGRLFVEEACSGVQSLYTLVFCAVLIVVVLGRAMCLLPIYVALAVLWAGLMNVIRIVAIAVVKHWYGLDWSHGWQHSTIGYVSLGIAVLLLLSSDRVIRVLFFPTKPEDRKGKLANPIMATWNYLFWDEPRHSTARRTSSSKSLGLFAPAMMAVAISLCLWQSVQAMNRMSAAEPIATGPKEPFLNVPDTIPSTAVANFTQVGHEQVRGSIDLPMGENADVWRGVVAGVPVTLALNQPYPAWHDLTICYRGTGWQLNDRQNVIAADSGQREWDYTLSRWITDGGTYAYVWFCAFDERGQYVESADRSLMSRIRFRINGDKPEAYGRIAMVQMVVESDSALPPDTFNALEEAFLDGRQFLVSMTQPDVSPAK